MSKRPTKADVRKAVELLGVGTRKTSFGYNVFFTLTETHLGAVIRRGRRGCWVVNTRGSDLLWDKFPNTQGFYTTRKAAVAAIIDALVDGGGS